MLYCSLISDFSVLELPLPVVSVSSPRVTEAGQPLSLICTVTVVEYLIVNPQVQWKRQNGSIIGSSNPSVMISVVVFGVLSTHNVTFTPLKTSSAGQYTCMASINIPYLPLSLNNSASTSVFVQSKSYLFSKTFKIWVLLIIKNKVEQTVDQTVKKFFSNFEWDQAMM